MVLLSLVVQASSDFPKALIKELCSPLGMTRNLSAKEGTLLARVPVDKGTVHPKILLKISKDHSLSELTSLLLEGRILYLREMAGRETAQLSELGKIILSERMAQNLEEYPGFVGHTHFWAEVDSHLIPMDDELLSMARQILKGMEDEGLVRRDTVAIPNSIDFFINLIGARGEEMGLVLGDMDLEDLVVRFLEIEGERQRIKFISNLDHELKRPHHLASMYAVSSHASVLNKPLPRPKALRPVNEISLGNLEDLRANWERDLLMPGSLNLTGVKTLSDLGEGLFTARIETLKALRGESVVARGLDLQQELAGKIIELGIKKMPDELVYPYMMRPYLDVMILPMSRSQTRQLTNLVEEMKAMGHLPGHAFVDPHRTAFNQLHLILTQSSGEQDMAEGITEEALIGLFSALLNEELTYLRVFEALQGAKKNGPIMERNQLYRDASTKLPPPAAAPAEDLVVDAEAFERLRTGFRNPEDPELGN